MVILPAGALADMVDRRRFLLATQGWMVVAAALLGILTLRHAVTPWTLYFVTAGIATLGVAKWGAGESYFLGAIAAVKLSMQSPN